MPIVTNGPSVTPYNAENVARLAFYRWLNSLPIEQRTQAGVVYPAGNLIFGAFGNSFGQEQMVSAVVQSVEYMQAERWQRYADNSKLPAALVNSIYLLPGYRDAIPAVQFTRAGYGDAQISAAQFFLDLENIRTGQPLRRDYQAPDGVMPYDDERIEQAELEKQLKVLRAREAAALAELARQGATPAQVLAISQTATATDPSTDKILDALAANMLLGQVTASPAEVAAQAVTPNVSAVESNAAFSTAAQLTITGIGNLALPGAMRENLVDQAGQREIAARSITIGISPDIAKLQSIYDASPDAWKPILTRMLNPAKQATEKSRWEGIAPKVELLAGSNPHLTSFQLNTLWTGDNPPLAVVRVTPRQKEIPKPKASGFLKLWSWLGPVVGMIPVVGSIASAVGGIVAAQMTKANINESLNSLMNMVRPLNSFEPQYYPQPFDIVLPLDKAQLIAREPWAAWPVYEWFAANEAKSYAAKLSAAVAASPAQNQAVSKPKTMNPFALAFK